MIYTGTCTCIYTADFKGFWNYIYSTKLYIARNPLKKTAGNSTKCTVLSVDIDIDYWHKFNFFSVAINYWSK